MRSFHRLRGFAAGLALTLACGAPALADDTEIFAGGRNGARPNVLLILDTSGSMEGNVDTQAPYNPATEYPGSCDRTRVFWRRDINDPPKCDGSGNPQSFDRDQLKCAAALQAFATGGFFIADGAGQWNSGSGFLRWEGLRNDVRTEPVECRADAGLHGENAGDAAVWAFNSGQAGVRWSEEQTQQISWNSNGTERTYVLYDANWLNWYNEPGTIITRTRLQVVQEAASNLVRSISGVNVGLMRYSNNTTSGDEAAEGGMVTFPVTPVESARDALVDTINTYRPDGFTPLSETLYEAQQYLAGRPVDYGLDSRLNPGEPFPSVPESRIATNQSLYKSPAELSCQRNFIVYLTDGLPTADTGADDLIQNLPEFDTLVGTQCDGSGDGHCLDDLAEYLRKRDLVSSVSGQQNAITYTIGFGEDVAGSAFLETTAHRGGGRNFFAGDTASLTTAFTNIVADIQRTRATFTAPATAINAFNRAETLSDLYVSEFEPSNSFQWIGNVKKFRIVLNAAGEPVVSDQEVWSGSTSTEVPAGGAASELPAPGARNLYTLLGTPDLAADPSNRVTTTNALITPALLGIGAPSQPSVEQLVNWARGMDVRDVDGDGDLTEARLQMGDPLHARLAVVIYGGSNANPDLDDAVVFAATNDGYLHAIDADTGNELWAFIPPELLDRLINLYENGPESTKRYGLDGDVRSFKLDRDRDGIVEPADGDRVLLFFGMGRGGNNYYALDVTSQNQPRHLWTLGPNELPGVGQTWSPPAVTRVTVRNRTQNADRLALVIGGGYDDVQDNDQAPTLYRTDAIGNRIFIVDAINGNLLWAGGGAGIRDDELNLDLPRMNNSIPAGVRVIDFDSDGFGDRLYAGDMGGRVWRFDIVLDSDAGAAGVQAPDADGLITGGVLASLGNADQGSHPNVSTRRFYSTPDVALVTIRNAAPFMSIALGSGWRGHPLNTQVQDRFYSVRDYQPFIRRTQADYRAADDDGDFIVDDDLLDITDDVSPVVPDRSPGWKLELRLPGGFEGEKVLVESRTFDNQVFFTTFTPAPSADPCAVGGAYRAFAVSVNDGSPVTDINRDGQTTLADRYTDTAEGTNVNILLARPGSESPGGGGGGGGTGDDGQGSGRPVICLTGRQILPDICRDAGTPVRTYWRQSPQAGP